jgi:kynurenine formamidase
MAKENSSLKLVPPPKKDKKRQLAILRTGVVPEWYKNPSSRPNYFNPQTGIAKDVVTSIKEHEISAMATDNIGLERSLNEIDPKTVSLTW